MFGFCKKNNGFESFVFSYFKDFLANNEVDSEEITQSYDKFIELWSEVQFSMIKHFHTTPELFNNNVMNIYLFMDKKIKENKKIMNKDPHLKNVHELFSEYNTLNRLIFKKYQMTINDVMRFKKEESKPIQISEL